MWECRLFSECDDNAERRFSGTPPIARMGSGPLASRVATVLLYRHVRCCCSMLSTDEGGLGAMLTSSTPFLVWGLYAISAVSILAPMSVPLYMPENHVCLYPQKKPFDILGRGKVMSAIATTMQVLASRLSC